MVLEPIGQNAQVQRLTTALKNICRDYPAGGTILRELLQNADDAGATEVKFVLDERTYPIDELVNPKVRQYQGPALLAYNNAEFTDRDFESLSRLGDSLKFSDGSTTGKFGRGFNAVYNWTDSPSIVSRNRLLILDPHCEWSLGGPVCDFVKDSGDLAMKNQMAAFQSVIEDVDQHFDGTVIRIPLRTQAQATKSDISKRATTVAEVLEVLKNFASEFGDSGLLFMRSIQKLDIKSDTISIKIEIVNGEAVQSHKSKVTNAVESALQAPGQLFDHSFEAAIEYRSTQESRKNTFIVHHSINHSIKGVKKLRDWAGDQKLIPWVAVAAQLPIHTKLTVDGALFNVLPLPISTSQPVHIHGLFSLSPDRARLYELTDKSTQDQNPARWNNYLLQSLVPIAWTKLLNHVAHLYPSQPAFHRWPRSIDDGRHPLGNALDNVLEIINNESIALWPTDVGFVTARAGLLCTEDQPVTLKNALREAGAPVVYVPEPIQHRAEDVFKDRILCPKILCGWLKSKSYLVSSWSDETKREILGYLLSEPELLDYGDLELFPFEDGVYRSIKEHTAFVHRDNFEKSLFSLDGVHNLDLQKLSEKTQRTLKHRCSASSIHPSIQYRSAKSLGGYCRSTVFKDLPEGQDMVVLGEESAVFVSRVWTWISRRDIKILDKDVCCLWLFPLSNGYHRRVKPQIQPLPVYIAPVGEVGQLMWEFDAKSSEKPLPLLRSGPEWDSPQFMPILINNPDIMSKLSIQNAESIVVFLEWLHRTNPLVENSTDEEKHLITRLVASNLPQLLISAKQKACIQTLRHLKIFQKLSWIIDGDKMRPNLTWTNLRSCSKSVGLLDTTMPVPDIDGIQFLVVGWSSSSKQLLQALKLVDCLPAVQIIQDYIIPAWETEQASSWSPACKEQLAMYIFGQFSMLSSDLQTKLRTIHMVPVTQLDGKETSRFATAAELIDPSITELTELYFDDDAVCPKKAFFEKFKVALRECGLKTGVDEAVVEHRIHCYASANYPLSEILDRAKKLMLSVCHWTSPLNRQEGSSLRRLKWLPARDLKDKLSLRASNECRDLTDKLLVDSQFPVLPFYISNEWRQRLGWDGTLPTPILLSQLDTGIQTKNRKIVDAIIMYISENNLTEELVDQLRILPCVLVSRGSFFPPSQTFRPPKRSTDGCDNLQPYLANVDRKFWQDHKDILRRLGVGDQPQPTDLLDVQARLEAKPMLEEADMVVANEVLRLASKLSRASLAGLKVLNADGRFSPIEDINYDDLGALKPKRKVNLTHPDIPLTIIRRLGIDSMRELLMKGMLEIDDTNDDDDEFDQREDVTTRIADTLDRYPVEATFREYLANADDANGASKISWLLDDRLHPCDGLLTPLMNKFQGPAFLAHNDGVFSDDDLRGFKNVGEGSKADKRETIGQFGRGSQTMYHWTDVPMILSGKYLLILDPQKVVLPRNRMRGQPKPGIKLELSKLRHACRNQLTPFENLWGYTLDLDEYPGTIFRFPLRTFETESRLSKTKIDSGEVRRLMNIYFDEARISLLFLRRIRSIDFTIYGKRSPEWSVTRRPPLDEDTKSFSELVVCSFSKTMEVGPQMTGVDKWWVVIEDLQSVAGRSPDSSRRVMKNVECGLAGLISSQPISIDTKTVLPKAIQSSMFNILPLPISSDLPVHIHATFMLSGDRRSIAIDEYGTKSHGSDWNRHILEVALPKLYLTFLDEIGKQIRQRVFEFWPQNEAPKGSCSELLCASFWKELPKSPLRLFPKAQPIVESSQRRPAELFDIDKAVFDFLPKDQSDILAPLLISLGVNLVRHVPTEVAKHLQRYPGVNFIKGKLLRPFFKSERSRECLLTEMAKNSRILDVLYGQLITNETEIEDLNGCYLLLLANGDLATLELAQTNNSQSPKYYVASAEELKLFEFASSCLVTPSTGKRLRVIIDSGKFNLTNLKLSHIDKLFKMRPTASFPDAKADRWLTDFWAYWNKNIESPPSSPNLEGLDGNIFRATYNGVDMYATTAEFNKLPAVVEPSMGEHQQLCNKVPGLYRFNAKFMPKHLADNEKSFHKDVAIHRFVRALRILAGDVGIETFIKSCLDLSEIKVLRGLIVTHVLGEILDRESAQFPGLEANLRSIPLWPSFQPSSDTLLISANNALIAANDHLLVPWMKDCHRFVHPQFSSDYLNEKCLIRLRVKKLSMEVLLRDYVLPLPPTLDNTYWRYFEPLIGVIHKISSDGLHALKQSKIAADGNRNLKKACELYDHDDAIFRSAFRYEGSIQFLHDSIRNYREFWLKVGLRHRVNNLINARDYIQCLRVMKQRLSTNDSRIDPYLKEDTRVVLSPLTVSNSNIQGFAAHDWHSIFQEKVFPSRIIFNSESEYRQKAMASMVADQHLLRLSEVILYDHAAVCWSQTPFPLYQPTEEVIRMIPGNCQPTIEMVWKHLHHMEEAAQHLKQYQMRDFLTDLHRTYEYLQDRLQDSKAGFKFKDSAIWLNLDSSDHNTLLLSDIKSSWYKIDNLVLSSSCDAGEVKAVRPYLMRFEKLLRVLGCNSIIFPTITRPELHHGHSISHSLRKLRDEGKLVDITYSSEGRSIQAHRVVLAAISEKCAHQFSGRWETEDLIKYDEDNDPDSFLSYKTLSIMIKFAYGDDIDWKEMEVSDNVIHKRVVNTSEWSYFSWHNTKS